MVPWRGLTAAWLPACWNAPVDLTTGPVRRARGARAPTQGSAPWSGRCGRCRRAPSGRGRPGRPASASKSPSAYVMLLRPRRSTRTPTSSRAGILQLAEVAAARLGDDAELGQGHDVDAGAGDQPAVDRGVEQLVVDGVVEVAVHVVVRPPGRRRYDVVEVRTGQRPRVLGCVGRAVSVGRHVADHRDRPSAACATGSSRGRTRAALLEGAPCPAHPRPQPGSTARRWRAPRREGHYDAKSGRSARTKSARPLGSSHSSWRPSGVRSRKA